MKRVLVVCGVFILMVLAEASAAVYTVLPDTYGSLYYGETGFHWDRLVTGEYWGCDWASFVKYTIPSYPGETITKVEINAGPFIAHANEPIPPGTYGIVGGLLLTRVADNSWTATTITRDWPVTTDTVLNRPGAWWAPGTEAPNSGVVISDITSWCQGEGTVLSLRMTRDPVFEPYACGEQQIPPPDITLTITTVPEPASLSILGLGLWCAIRRRSR